MTTQTEALAWQDRAACAGLPLDAFFPPPGVVSEAAQRACSRCPVRLPCADYGRTQTHGVWGGVPASAKWRGRVLTVKPAVPEGLQPAGVSPYRLADTTTTTLKEPAMTAKTTTTKTAPAPAPTPDAPESQQADVDAGSGSKSTVSQDGTAVCGGCKADLPVTKYPTKRTPEGEYVRDLAECRACRDARRTNAKTAKADAAAKATAA